MSIKVICDRCGSEDGALDDSAWRTICVQLEYLSGAREFGSSDTLFELQLCHQCVEIVNAPEGPDLEAAILEAIAP